MTDTLHRLSDIAPACKPSFSPNLHAWMRKNSHFFTSGGTPDRVWRVRAGAKTEWANPGALFIGYGYDDDRDFSGSRLMGVLCNGKKEQRWCFLGLARHLEPVEGFWGRYLQVGRCAVDPDHHIHYQQERWHSDGDRRTCLWCGHEQARSVVKRVVEDEVWA